MKFNNLEDYVKKQGGKRVLKKVLLANNGIAAVKCIRSVRRWCYESFGNEKEIEFVAMATPEDLKANAEYIRMADSFVEVPAGSNVNNYANVSLICQLAEKFEVDGVWAGWGHASENPSLPRTLDSMGVTFIGPPAGPMYALGDKIGSTIIAQSADVPTIAWNGQSLKVDYKTKGEIEPELYNQANITSAEACLEAVKRVGLPVMIKASEGGGGKGIRKVNLMENVETAFRQVQSEVLGSPIFVMKLAPKSRHLEVQLLADEYGNAIALNGRDCSVQRRHQKILEEGPPIAAPPDIWLEMEKAAVRLAKEVGYVNAGTVEYLFCEIEGKPKFFFLELNPRLQVEHPVTEMITGVNLPALQMNVAMGIRLDRIPQLREIYNYKPYEQSVINFETSKMRAPMGHVIAARITAENPFDGFTPTSGRIKELNFRSSRHVWGYFSVDSSGNVHEFADSQFGHLFSWGQNREQARRNLVMALKDISIRGEIRTTVEYLNDMIEAEEYKANKIDTSWLDGRIQKKIKPITMDKASVAIIGAACKCFLIFQARKEEFLELLKKGRMPGKELLDRRCEIELILEDVKYLIRARQNSAGSVLIECNDDTVSVGVRVLADNGILASCAGKSNLCYLKKEVSGTRLELNGQNYIFAEEYDPTKLRAKMGGKLLRYLVPNGARVEKNQPFAEIEVMKMNMQVLAQETGLISLLKPEGAVMEPGDIMCTMKIEDTSKIRKARLFEGKIPSELSTYQQFAPSLPHSNLEIARTTIRSVLEGFIVDKNSLQSALDQLFLVTKNPMLPIMALEEILARVKNSIPLRIFKKLAELGATARENISLELQAAVSAKKINFADTVVGLNNLSQLIADRTKDNPKAQLSILRISETYCSQTAAFLEAEFTSDDARTLRNSPEMVSLYNIAQDYKHGAKVYLVTEVNKMLLSFYDAEKIFAEMELSDSAEKDDELQELRGRFQDELDNVYNLAMSHSKVIPCSYLVIQLLRVLEKNVREEEEVCIKEDNRERKIRKNCLQALKKIATLQGSQTTDVALEARTLLLELQQKSYKQQLTEIENKLLSVGSGNLDILNELTTQSEALLHFLITIISTTTNEQLNKTAMEVYIRRVYANYSLDQISYSKAGTCSFKFKAEPDIVSSMTPKMAQATSYEDLTSLLNDGQDTETYEDRSERSLNIGGEAVTRARMQSLDELVPIGAHVSREGLFCHFSSVSHLTSAFEGVLKNWSSTNSAPVNVIHALITATKWDDNIAQDISPADAFAQGLNDFLKSKLRLLDEAGIRRITFAVFPEGGLHRSPVAGHGCGFYTFRSRIGFSEDKLVRDIETPFAFQLDLSRMANFSISLVSLGNQWKVSNNVNVYKAVPKKGKRKVDKKALLSGKRYFVRALVRQTKKMDTEHLSSISALDSYPGPEKVFNACLAALEAVQRPQLLTQNHVFLNILGNKPVDPKYVENVVKSWTLRYSKRLRIAGVSDVEIKFIAKIGDSELPMRFICANPTGFALEMSRYIEASDPVRPEGKCFFSVNDLSSASEEEPDFVAKENAELHGLPLSTPYKIATHFDEKRALATRVGTAYVYDYPTLFLKALQLAWKKHAKAFGVTHANIPDLLGLVSSEELVLEEEAPSGRSCGHGLVSVNRPLGENEIGMVAWKLKILTPEFPTGRTILVIANDITIKAGSFGTKEDELFYRASKLARSLGLPRIYIAANSGARIGLADQIKSIFGVKLKDSSNPERGFEYLYLSKSQYEQYGPNGDKAVLGEWIDEEQHYKITTIIGNESDLGVENLRGSGKIAGETSRAYNETFTLTYVSGRSVGIGAYLVRLGQRTIQKGTNAPIILTGFNALNALMGRKVYSSNLQLGGTKVMYNNGVSHLCVRNDLEGVREIINWISFLPKTIFDTVKQLRLPLKESILREVEYCPNKLNLNVFDPRNMLTGATVDRNFLPGFCDVGSFTETLAGWAKTVIIGRGRLGGLPLGLIVSEMRTVEKKAPADPASPESSEQIVQQAGQVWFPDSAYKTAQAISDFNKEGLPLMIFANWRGFSGGQRDMFDEVLKFGSFIVDELVKYKQPVFVYIIPTGELRGGAWVVVDETINSETMEMYAADTARGNVLEPTGAASIKFKRPDIHKAMHRTDATLLKLTAELKTLEKNPVDKLKQIVIVESEIKEREDKLFPVYTQIATHFVDLHDRPGRMKQKGVIREVVPWKNARMFFFNRLKKRLAEQKLFREIQKVPGNSITLKEASQEVDKLLAAHGLSDTRSNQEQLKYLDSENFKTDILSLKDKYLSQAMKRDLLAYAGQDKLKFVDCLKSMLLDMKKEGKEKEVRELLSKLSI